MIALVEIDRANFLGAQASLPACIGQSVIAGTPAGKDACAPRKFALIPSMRPFGKNWQPANLPYPSNIGARTKSEQLTPAHPMILKSRHFSAVYTDLFCSS
jgi:hypothetical protein